jgi:ABC-type oligopeptide transport system substrate-binding subunit
MSPCTASPAAPAQRHPRVRFRRVPSHAGGPARRALIAALALPALLVTANLSAKTLVYCSEGSPENFYPGVNTTGTSFDANSQIYSRIVDFERGGTAVVPGLAERWDISPDGKVYTFTARVYGTTTAPGSRRVTSMPTT